MTLVLSIAALIGLIIFAVGAILHLFTNPPQPRNTLLMVVGGLVFAVAQIILLLIAVIP
jgi:hypothetical protein